MNKFKAVVLVYFLLAVIIGFAYVNVWVIGAIGAGDILVVLVGIPLLSWILLPCVKKIPELWSKDGLDSNSR